MIALDTNVLIYACDRADSRRQQIAIDLVTNQQGRHPALASRLRVRCCFSQAERTRLHRIGRGEPARRIPCRVAPRPSHSR